MLKPVPLNHNRDFKRAYARGKFAAHPLIVSYVLKNKLGINRVGITASKKIGNAVKRNRARRIIRHAYYEVGRYVPQGYDIVFVARTKTTFAKSSEIVPIMKAQLKSLGALQPENGAI